MSSVERYNISSLPVTRGDRRAARAITAHKSITQVRQSEIADEADVEGERIEQLTYLTATGMSAVARVGALQKQLEQQAPELAGRLNMMADTHALLTSMSIEDAARKIRRL